MSKITVKCGDCAKRYTVPDTYAGKRFKCKGCGASIRVPGGRSETGEHAAAETGGRKTAGRATRRPTTSARATRARAGAAAEGPPKNRALLVLSGVGCLFLIVAIIYFVANMETRTKKKKKKEATVEKQEPVIAKKPPAPEPDPDPLDDIEDPAGTDETAVDEPKKDEPKKPTKKAEPEKPKKKEFRLPPIPRVAVGKVAHFDDTPDDVKETIDTKVAVVADPWAGPKGNRARTALLEIGRPAVPALLTAMAELDFQEEDSRMAMPNITMTLQEITKARNSLICRVGMQGGATEEEKQMREIHKCKHNRAEWFVWWKRYAKK